MHFEAILSAPATNPSYERFTFGEEDEQEATQNLEPIVRHSNDEDSGFPVIISSLSTKCRAAALVRVSSHNWKFVVRKSVGGYDLKTIYDMPPLLRTILSNKFKPAYLKTHERCLAFEDMMDNLKDHSGGCVNYTINKKHKRKQRQTWQRADSVGESACDQCIKDRKLCVRPILQNGLIKFRFYPLPLSNRHKATKWYILSYWIQS